MTAFSLACRGRSRQGAHASSCQAARRQLRRPGAGKPRQQALQRSPPLEQLVPPPLALLPGQAAAPQPHLPGEQHV